MEIFNAWVNLKGIKSGGTRSLDAGRVIWKMLEGAEIIRHTYKGGVMTRLLNSLRCWFIRDIR
ncbi:hypothetical protein P4S72_21700 [Vibrio sp. PP-XX7]